MKRRKNRIVRRQWKIYRGMLIAAGMTLLAFPVAATSNFAKLEDKYQVCINGEPVGVAESYDVAKAAYQKARLTLNSQLDTLNLLDAEVTFEHVKVKPSQVMTEAELGQSIYDNLATCLIWDKSIAYTLKIDEYTVTLRSEQEILDLLERVQAEYDPEQEFVVELTGEAKEEVGALSANIINISKTANNASMLATDEEGNVVVAGPEADVGEDGILTIGFMEDIEVVETYARDDQLVDVDTAFADITKEEANNEVYKVQAGDCLSTIASNYGMSISELLAINDGMTVDSNLLVGDQIVVQVPKPELSVISQTQTTYTEDYEADVQYVDNPDRYVGDNKVTQEPVAGNRTVTAIVNYTNGAETGRKIIKQTINSEPVPKIVERGTKPLPTYIYPTTYGRLSSPFGARWGTTHTGMDIAVPTGTACRASRAGTVVQAGWNGSYGYNVLIDHGDGIRTRYAHLSKIQCGVGQYVNQGDVIALTGNTGNSTGPHVHFEVIVNGRPVNPAGYLN